MVATVGFEPTEHSTGAFNRVQADSLKPLGHITVLKMGGTPRFELGPSASQADTLPIEL